VTKLARVLALVSVIALLVVTPAMAQEGAGGGAGGGPAAGKPWTLINLTAALGCGLVVIGAGYGIGRLAASAVESMARQPEVAGNIQTAMIIAAALIEGFTFFALFICWQQV